MKMVAQAALEPGMIIAENIYNNERKIILRKDTVLDSSQIKKLGMFSIVAVPIKDAIDFASTHFERLRLTPEFQTFERVYRNNLTIFKHLINNVINKKALLNTESIMQLHNNVVKCTKSGEQLLDMLYNLIPGEDEVTYAHCFNAGLISSVFGSWLALTKEDIALLTVCGYIYDIGKITMPQELIWKPDKLTEFEFNYMKNHTGIGYDILKDSNLDNHILKAVYQHHERCDGTGYPNGAKDDEIDFYAKCISIIDGYEAMTSARAYRAAMNPFQVINIFQENGLEKYSYYVIKPILEKIANAHLGATVRLSDESIGEVIIINPSDLGYPLIKINETVIDLSKNKNISIVNML